MQDGDVRDDAFGRALDPERRPEVVRALLDEGAVAGGELDRAVERVVDDAVRDLSVERMEPELEPGDDPEVRPRAAHPPEQLRVLVLARAHLAAVRGDEVDGEQAVDRQAELALEPAHATAERQAAHTGVRDDADRTDEPVRLRRGVEPGEVRAAADPGGARLGVDVDAADRCEVDHDPVVAGGEAGDAVAAAADGDDELLLAGEAERSDDVVSAGRLHDQRRPPVDRAVPDRARRVVAGVVRADHFARECVRQRPHPRELTCPARPS